MKILLLNPAIGPEHPIAMALKNRGVAVLFPAHAEEAWQLLQLHGQSVDLALIHREGVSSEPKGAALQLLLRIKSDPTQSDLPVILTTSEWKEQQCAQHQQSAEGANAYIFEAIEEKKLFSLIEAVLGQKIPSPKTGIQVEIKGATVPKTQSHSHTEAAEGSRSIPLDISLVHEHDHESAEAARKTLSEFQLEAPDISLVNLATDTSPSEKTSVSISLQQRAPESRADEEVKLDSPGEMSLNKISFNPADFPSAYPIQEDSPVPSLVSEVKGTTIDELSLKIQLDELPSRSKASEERGQDDLSPLDSGSNPDAQAEQEMPYLYQNQSRPMALEPIGDAVVPGGMVNTPDLETLKKYLTLREQDVAVLSAQLKEARDQISQNEKQLREERAKNVELLHTCQEQKKKLDEENLGRNQLLDKFEAESEELRFQVRSRTDQLRGVENQLKQLSEEMEQLKERVRVDIRKIRVREKELENRLELTKRDSEALLSSREAKIIELKRSMDLLEFNMDLLQNQYAKEKDKNSKLREQVAKLGRLLKIADGLLDQSGPEAAVDVSLEQSEAEKSIGKKAS